MSLFADSESSQVAIATVFSILMILDIIGNSLVCVIIASNHDMRTPFNFLLVNLAVADLMVAVFFSPLHVFQHTFTHPDGVTGEVLCKLLTGGSLGWVGGVSSVFTLVAIAIERYYEVNYPHSNKGKLTMRKLKIIIPSCWIFSLIMNIPEFLARTFEKSLNTCIEEYPDKWMGKAYSMTWLVAFAVLPILIMVTLYSTVVYNLWFKRQEYNKLSCQQKGVIKVRKRVTLMVVMVSVIFAVCWLADGIIYVLGFYSSTHKANDVTFAIAFTLILFNSAINPFVYALVNERFWEKIKKMVCCKCRRGIVAQAASETDGNKQTNNPAKPSRNAETIEL